MSQSTIQKEQIIRRAEFRTLTGISRSTEWRLNQKSLLPAALIIDGRNLGYLKSSYIDWLHKNSTK